MLRFLRLVLIDDDKTVRDDISANINQIKNIEIIAHGYNGQEAVELCEELHPDLVLMDILMPVMNGIEATKIIRSRYPETTVIVCSGLQEIALVRDMLIAGASGFILKGAGREEIEAAIRAVFGGKIVMSAELMNVILAERSTTFRTARDFGLTPKEMQILHAASKGWKDSEIAEQFMITPRTVRFHLSNIVKKLGAKNRTEMLVIAIRYKLI